jgi:hypothetical protein
MDPSRTISSNFFLTVVNLLKESNRQFFKDFATNKISEPILMSTNLVPDSREKFVAILSIRNYLNNTSHLIQHQSPCL